jgi:hypothetical protein
VEQPLLGLRNQFLNKAPALHVFVRLQKRLNAELVRPMRWKAPRRSTALNELEIEPFANLGVGKLLSLLNCEVARH